MTTHANPPSLPDSYPAPPTPAAPPPDQQPPATPIKSAAAGRRTSRRGLIISILVVLIGGVIAFAGGQLLTQHTSVLVMAKDVPIGARITDADLTTASVVKDANLSTIPASDRSQIVGMVAQVGLKKGTNLTRNEVGPRNGFTAGQQLVALPLKPGQFPGRGLTPGQEVLIVSTPGSDGTTSDSGPTNSSTKSDGEPSTTGGNATAGGVDATIVDVGSMNSATQVTVIDVKVDQANGIQVARLASTGNLALILLPAGR